MSRKYGLNAFLWATGSLLSGIALGTLLSPKSGKQNRKLLSKRATRLRRWISTQYEAAGIKGRQELINIRRNVQGGLRRNIPDLYEATAQIELSEHELS
ncbi:MAG TPA: YtxH domain-containing protein [Fodinibius sp.]|nr:YtxH domain-containing protein [Fodinibius sp.]